MTTMRLGRNVNHDERSRQYPYRAVSGDAVLESVRHERHVPVWDQGDLGSCTGMAGLGCVGTGALYGPASDRQTYWREEDALAVYSLATRLDPFEGEYPPNDTGSDGLSVAKVLKSAGLISGYLHTFSLSDLLSALQDQPLIVGTNWYETMFTPNQYGEVSIGLGAEVAGGHEYILDEYDADLRMVGCQNSWGTSWGMGGRFFLHIATLRRLLSEDGDATVLLPANAPAPDPIPDLDLAQFATKINRWRRSAFPVFGAQAAQKAVDKYLKSQGL